MTPPPEIAFFDQHELFAAHHRAGGSIGDDGWLWTVSGVNGENRIVARGRTQSEAW